MLFNAIIVRLIVHVSGNGPITMKLMPQKMDHTGLVLSLITFYKLLQAQMTQQLRMINLLLMIILALPHLQILATKAQILLLRMSNLLLMMILELPIFGILPLVTMRFARIATFQKVSQSTIAGIPLNGLPYPLVKGRAQFEETSCRDDCQ